MNSAVLICSSTTVSLHSGGWNRLAERVYCVHDLIVNDVLVRECPRGRYNNKKTCALMIAGCARFGSKLEVENGKNDWLHVGRR